MLWPNVFLCCFAKTNECEKEETKAQSIFYIAAAPVMQTCVLAEVLVLLNIHFKQAIITAAAHMKYQEQKYLHLCFSLEREERSCMGKNKGFMKGKDRECVRKIVR